MSIKKNTRSDSEVSSARKPPSYPAVSTEDEIDNHVHQTKSTSPSPQISRLLEPLHKLHSLQDVHIKGPVSEDYKKNLLLHMHGPLPRDQEMFDIVLAKFEYAMSLYQRGDQFVALTQMKLTLDTMKDQKRLRKYDSDGRAVISTGPYAGHTFWDAQRNIRTNLQTKVAWALTKTVGVDRVWELHSYVHKMSGGVDDPNSYWNELAMGHEAAILFYLAAHVWNALNRLGWHHVYERSYYLQDVVGAIRERLRHEPGNEVLDQELRRRLDKLEEAAEAKDIVKEEKSLMKETGDLMEMWNRINAFV